MDHNEAVKQMAVERYLLDELTPEARDAFEQHAFDCSECALDLRVAAAFVSEAKSQLPGISSPSSASSSPSPVRPPAKKRDWSFWWKPAFAMPAFAVLLGVIAYQNLSTIPSLRKTVDEPRIVRPTAIHAGTRGAAHVAVMADRTQGLVLSIELPQISTYASYAFELYDPSSKKIWTSTVTNSNPGSADDGVVSLTIPGHGLQAGSYTLNTFGLAHTGGRIELDRHVLDVHFGD